MTIPTLMSKYQKHTYVVRLKKAYSQLQNAIKMIPITEGCPAGDYNCTGLSDYNNCKQQAYLFSKQFKTQDVDLAGGVHGICHLTKSYPTLPCFRTTDGTIYSICNNKIILDTNGTKEPNAYGRDRFAFFFTTETENENFNAFNSTVGRIIPAGSVIPFGDYRRWENICTKENFSNSGDPWDAYTCTGRVLEEDAMNY